MRVDVETLKAWLKVYLILGSANCRREPEAVLREAVSGGVSLFQFREKGAGALTGEARYRLAERMQAICKRHGVPFIVNDDVELALELDADGVHIGQEDEAADQVRNKIGDGKILGVSAYTLRESEDAIRMGADYLGIGPIYATTTKADAKAAQGTMLIQALRRNSMDIPLVGIGGIHAENARQVMEAGADGVSVISAISLAPSPQEAAYALRTAVFEKFR